MVGVAVIGAGVRNGGGAGDYNDANDNNDAHDDNNGSANYINNDDDDEARIIGSAPRWLNSVII